MKYYFNSYVAKNVGVSCAIVLSNIEEWLIREGTIIFDSKKWIKIQGSTSETFPFWTTAQVNRLVKKLATNGYLEISDGWISVCEQKRPEAIIHKEKRTVFERPPLAEIITYFENNDSNESLAKAFYNFYDSKGWKVGNQKMKVWKAAASGFINRNKNKKMFKDLSDDAQNAFV